jgi:TetR/AcrR family transcriptional regulator
MSTRTSTDEPGEQAQSPDAAGREAWAERAADRSPSVQRSRDRSVEQARSIVAAARRLIEAKGPSFTTQELIKEAGIALQTFYRYFPGKDALLLAVIENIIDENCAAFREQARTLSDPVERVRFYVTATVRGLHATGSGPSFMTAEHFRLQTLYPTEVSRATQPYTDLLVEEIREATAVGHLRPQDPEYSAWLITQLTMAVFHHYDCAGLDEPTDEIARKLWAFCLAALDGGGR